MTIINCTEENSDYTVKKAGVHHLNHVIKLVMGQSDYRVPLPETPKKTTVCLPGCS